MKEYKDVNGQCQASWTACPACQKHWHCDFLRHNTRDKCQMLHGDGPHWALYPFIPLSVSLTTFQSQQHQFAKMCLYCLRICMQSSSEHLNSYMHKMLSLSLANNSSRNIIDAFSVLTTIWTFWFFMGTFSVRSFCFCMIITSVELCLLIPLAVALHYFKVTG